VQAAGTLGFDVSEVLAEVANAVTRSAHSPKGQSRALRDNHGAPRPDGSPAAPVLATGSFPSSPLVPRAGTAPAVSLSRTGSPASRLRPARRSR
jgi:hypothetical protein